MIAVVDTRARGRCRLTLIQFTEIIVTPSRRSNSIELRDLMFQ